MLSARASFQGVRCSGAKVAVVTDPKALSRKAVMVLALCFVHAEKAAFNPGMSKQGSSVRSISACTWVP